MSDSDFTVMESEGALLTNGIAFAPSVDTNVWSFCVDTIHKKLTVTAGGMVLVIR